MGDISGSKAPPQAAVRLGPSGYDPGDGEGLAKALHAALIVDSPSAHIDPWGVDDRVVIDGTFDLLNVAQLLFGGCSSPRGASICPDKIQAFTDKHCGGKEARLDLLLDMCSALGMRLGAIAIETQRAETGNTDSVAKR